MMATFHSTGAKYGMKNFRWLLRMPSAQADSTSTPVIGNTMRTKLMVSSRRCPSNPGVNTVTSNGASRMPSSEIAPATPSSSANIAPRDAARFLRASLGRAARNTRE